MVRPAIYTKARYLRKKETNAEKILWQELKNCKLGVKFRRQHPLEAFILDFYSPSTGIAIELDGLSHKESKEYDQTRTDYLNFKNIKVLRFWNNEVEQNLDKVLDEIRTEIKETLGV